jgi:hypothetical protein
MEPIQDDQEDPQVRFERLCESDPIVLVRALDDCEYALSKIASQPAREESEAIAVAEYARTALRKLRKL